MTSKRFAIRRATSLAMLIFGMCLSNTYAEAFSDAASGSLERQYTVNNGAAKDSYKMTCQLKCEVSKRGKGLRGHFWYTVNKTEIKEMESIVDIDADPQIAMKFGSRDSARSEAGFDIKLNSLFDKARIEIEKIERSCSGEFLKDKSVYNGKLVSGNGSNIFTQLPPRKRSNGQYIRGYSEEIVRESCVLKNN